MKFYSEVLDKLFDTQEEVERAEAEEKAKTVDAEKEAAATVIKEYRHTLDELEKQFEEINKLRKRAESEFWDKYGGQAWADAVNASEEERKMIQFMEGFKTAVEKATEDAAGKASEAKKTVVKHRPVRVEIKQPNDFGAAIQRFLNSFDE